jgi:hypothetical protein
MLKPWMKLTVSPTEANFLPPLIFLAAAFIGGDFVVDLRLLTILGIEYPAWMNYAHLILPGLCAVLWLVLRPKWRRFGTVFPLVLCALLLPLVPNYVERQVAHVPLRRELSTQEWEAMKSRLGFPVTGTFSGEGHFMLVAPAHESQTRAELDRLGVLGPATRAAE